MVSWVEILDCEHADPLRLAKNLLAEFFFARSSLRVETYPGGVEVADESIIMPSHVLS